MVLLNIRLVLLAITMFPYEAHFHVTIAPLYIHNRCTLIHLTMMHSYTSYHDAAHVDQTVGDERCFEARLHLLVHRFGHRLVQGVIQ